MAAVDWQISVDDPSPERLGHYESLLSTANGRLGVRGATPWDHGARRPGTYLAGVFDALPGEVTELVNLPDWTWVRLFVDGREMRPRPAEDGGSRLQLDLRRGLFLATAHLRDDAGREAVLAVQRFVSLAQRDVACMQISVTPVNCRGRFLLETGCHLPAGERHLALKQVSEDDDGSGFLLLETIHGKRTIGIASKLTGGPEGELAMRWGADGWRERASWQGRDGQVMIFHRCLAFAHAPGGEDAADEVRRRARSAIRDSLRRGFDSCLASHVAAWEDVWARADVVIEGDPEAQLAVRMAVFHLAGAGPDDPAYSIAAKGLSGPGYRGHVFWDTEVFMLPFFTYVLPEIGRRLLAYRWLTLPGARAKAREQGFPGAMFAWESADTGEETCPSTYLNPETGETGRIWTGARELHITADVAWAVDRYVQVTGDRRLLEEFGAEIILACAQFWFARLERGEDDGLHLSGVIGPDEYHESVADNAYTNAMVRYVLTKAGELAGRLRRECPRSWEEIGRRLNLGGTESETWPDAARRIYLPAPGPDLVLEQFRGFFALGQPGPIKQPDVLMLRVTLPELLPPAMLKANWDYYEPRTDHGSSLSPSIHALIASELGLRDEAAAYFRRACRIDLQDSMGNGADGLHLANLGGIWQAVVHGFAGIQWRDGALQCDPRLPPGWRAIHCTICCRGSRFRVDVTRDHLEIAPITALAAPLPVRVGGRSFLLREPSGLKLPLDAVPPNPTK